MNIRGGLTLAEFEYVTVGTSVGASKPSSDLNMFKLSDSAGNGLAMVNSSGLLLVSGREFASRTTYAICP
jgi:hypothetical protein